MPGLVPGIFVLRRRKNVIVSAAKHSHPAVMPRDAIVRCDRNDFFIIFVDGIFTTFIERPFTNVSHAIRENPVMSCV